jgi:hypothetical protein
MNELLDLWDTIDKIHSAASPHMTPTQSLKTAQARLAYIERLAREAMLRVKRPESQASDTELTDNPNE